jgi:cytochrome c biogenesis protein CcdA
MPPEQIVIVDTVTELLEVARQGPPGGPGPAGAPGGALLTGTAGAALSGHMVVAYDDTGELVYASAATAEHAFTVAGVTTGAAAAGAQATVQRNDVMQHNGWAWTPGAPVFLGLGGALVQTPAVGGVFLKPIGLALTAQRLMLNIQPAMFLA